MTCKKCNKEYDDNFAYCPHCGKVQQIDEAGQEFAKCMSCEAMVDKDVRTCPKCGSDMQMQLMCNPEVKRLVRNYHVTTGMTICFILALLACVYFVIRKLWEASPSTGEHALLLVALFIILALPAPIYSAGKALSRYHSKLDKLNYFKKGH